LNSPSQGEKTRTESFRGKAASKLCEPLARTSSALSSLLSNSTIGVALFDTDLHCRAFNAALGRMIGVSLKKQIGRQLHEVFPGGALNKLEPAFRRVWATAISESNLELSAQSSAGTDLRRWVVNFYPITDEWGKVRLVATTFCEVTKGRCVELKLSRLKDKFRSHVLRRPAVLEEEFSETSTRTFELVNRSVALLKNSLSIRFQTSATQLGAALVRHALYMNSNPAFESAFSSARPSADSEADTLSSPEAPNETDPLVNCPSPRERQVLRFLADGKSSKEIGSILDISARTVECYRARIMLKLDLHSTAALVRYAVRNNIVEA
jgi:DNA-binding CsgD family transcriptional regulator